MTDKHQIADDLTTLAYPIEKLKHLDGNPRKGNVEAVKKSYEKFGQRKPIVATKDGEVISGNHQLAAARELGWNKIAVVFTNDDELTAKAFALADNRTADLGTYDDDLLADMLGAVSSDLEMLEATSFTEDDLYKLIGFDEVEEKELPETPKKAKTKFGDKYKLGNHFLICGDATNLDNYKIKCDIAFTDPPYGVNYEGGTKEKLKIENDTRFDLEDLLYDSFVNISMSIKGNVFICSPYKNVDIFSRLFTDIFNFSTLIVWKKDKPVLTRGHFNSFYELIFYGWLKNSSSSYKGTMKETDIWEIPRPKINDKHPTSKPVDLCKKAIELSSNVNDWVLDPFSGSGSTLIACESIKRRCYAIEFDPKYCDVIVERWENITGQKAELIDEIKVAD